MPRATTSSAGSTAPRFYRGEKYCADDSVGYLMRQIMASIVQMVDHRLEVHDLTHAQWAPLFKLAQGECATMAELARALQLDPGSMTRALDRLEAKDLVRRVRSHSDRRVVDLVLTDAGRELAGVVPGVLSEVLNLHLSGFTQAEWRQLVDMLQRMRSNGEALRAGGLPGAAEK